MATPPPIKKLLANINPINNFARLDQIMITISASVHTRGSVRLLELTLNATAQITVFRGEPGFASGSPVLEKLNLFLSGSC